MNESRTHVSNGRLLPWPWTLNHNGKAHFFAKKSDAYRYAQSLLDSGTENFDVGLGQMNWRWQSHRFHDLWDALDPYANLSAAARHFREQFDRPECNSWLCRGLLPSSWPAIG